MARRQRNTNNQSSNNQSQNNVSDTSVIQPSTTILPQEKKGFLERFNSTGGIVSVIIGIFVAGFGAGAYLNSIYNRIEKMEIDMTHQKEIEALKKEKYMTKEDVEEFINNYNKANDGSKK